MPNRDGTCAHCRTRRSGLPPSAVSIRYSMWDVVAADRNHRRPSSSRERIRRVTASAGVAHARRDADDGGDECITQRVVRLLSQPPQDLRLYELKGST